MVTSDDLKLRAFTTERQRQFNAAKNELRDIQRIAQQLERDLNSGAKSLTSGGRRLSTVAALLLERLAALDALESVSFMTKED